MTPVFRVFFTCLFTVSLLSGAARSEGQLVTVDDIKRIAPFAREEFARAIVDAQEELEAHGVNTRLRMAHFLAQVMTETGGLKRLDENMNYSFDALMRVFSRKTVSSADAQRIAGKPVEVANWVYGARLGNRGRDTMDGWNYRGSGYIQLTGRDNFLRRGGELEMDIAGDPALVRDPEVGLQAALAYWSRNNINTAADAHDRLKVRVLVNGPAAHGFSQSKAWFNKVWTNALRDKDLLGFEAGSELVASSEAQQTELYTDILTESGHLDPVDLALESADVSRADAIRAFQREHGLTESGQIDAATEDVLLDPVQWRPQQFEVEKIANVPDLDPETTIAIDLGNGEVTPQAATGFETVIASPAFSISGAAGSGPAEDTQTTLSRALARQLGGSSAIYPDYAPVDQLAAADSATQIDYGVIGPDDRRAATLTLKPLQRPVSSIVQIAFKTKHGVDKSCSGAMISSDTVLTAAHCIHSGTIKGTAYTDFVVAPGRLGGRTNFGECKASSANVLDGWVNATSLSELHDYDLGAIKLDCDVGSETGWFAVRSLDDSEVGLDIVVQGYASDRAPKGIQWVSTDVIRHFETLKGFHQADTFGGTSGAPVYVAGQTDTIVGIHTNTFFGLNEPWKSNNGFSRITPLRVETILGWIDQ